MERRDERCNESVCERLKARKIESGFPKVLYFGLRLCGFIEKT